MGMIEPFQMCFLLVLGPFSRWLSKLYLSPPSPHKVCLPNLPFLPFLLLFPLLGLTQFWSTNSVFSCQDQCDQRPATTNNHVTEGIPRQDFQHPETSPELPKRRVRHQGISQGWAKATGLLLAQACLPLVICYSNMGVTWILNSQAQ